MVLNHLHTLEDYAHFLRGNAKELDALYSDVLISVTSFFRNPEAFDILKRKVFPKLLQRRGEEPLRVWVLGCSTGQEAYSIAMTFLEAAEKAPRMRRLQVFATDLNDALLDKARHGLYARSLAEDISPERLRKYFVEEEGGYRISKQLREMVVFARQNLIADPPFSRMDVVSCRNLMIYLEPSLQRKLLPTFHYALKPEGVLFLGASESIGGFTDLFEPLDKKHKIYSRKIASTPALHLPVRKEHGEYVPRAPAPQVTTPFPSRQEQEEPEGLRAERNALREADRVMVTKYAPPGVLVNAELQIVQFRGATSAYLEPPVGKASFDVLKMAREGLMLPLRAAINKARKENKIARKEDVRVRRNGESRSVNIEVIPLKNLRERCFLVLFDDRERAEPVPKDATRTRGRAGKAAESRRVATLERELAETRDYLQSIQEQHEAANEELQAAGEEVQSANEELQSINEELETSKEELESTNEELTTVNEEMSNRNVELNRLNSDLVNLQTSTRLAIVLLDRDLTIRRFSAQAGKQFNLLASDVGRPISSLRHNLDLAELENFVGEVVSTVRERERDVRDKEGHWYSLRVRPYFTLDNRVDGVVLVLVDIDALKRGELLISEAREHNEAIIRTVPDPLLILRADLHAESANDAFYRTFKLAAAEVEGRLIFDLDRGAWNIPRLRELLEGILSRNSYFNDFEVVHDFDRLGRRTMLLNARPLLQADGKAARILLGVRDVTEVLVFQSQLRQSEARKDAILRSALDAIIIMDHEGRFVDVNPAAERMFGHSRTAALGRPVADLIIPPRLREQHHRGLAHYLATGEGTMLHRQVELPALRANGTEFPVEVSIVPVPGSNPPLFTGFLRDVSDRRLAESRLRESAERFRSLVEVSAQIVWMADPDGAMTDDSPSWRAFTGQTYDEWKGFGWLDAIHPDDRARVAEAWRDTVARKADIEIDYRLHHVSGEWRWTTVRATQIFTEDGAFKGYVGMNTDITERKQAEERQRLLANELAHRGKNLLAVVQAIAARSLTGTRSLGEARDALLHRLQALARGQSVLVSGGVDGASVGEIVRLELEIFSERVKIEGPEVLLTPKAAETFSLVVHELGTNAAKHGALSVPDGRVAVKWAVEGNNSEEKFRFQWREHDGPAVAQPSRRGFGSILLEQAAAQAFQTQPSLRFTPDGLRYDFDGPLSAIIARAPDDEDGLAVGR
jgi:PAS domain S-box-containing protein